jgi:hypothetical protein
MRCVAALEGLAKYDVSCHLSYGSMAQVLRFDNHGLWRPRGWVANPSKCELGWVLTSRCVVVGYSQNFRRGVTPFLALGGEADRHP